MCGIAGWINFSENLKSNSTIIKRMTETLERRGPDSEGVYESENVLVTYSQSLLDNYSSDRSNENTIIEDIQVNDCDGVKALYTAAGTTTTSIIWHDNVYVYSLSSDLSYEELLKIAETIE